MECFDCRWSWFKKPIHIVAHILHPLWKPKDQPIVMNAEMTDGWLGYIQKVYSIDDCEILQDQFDMYRNGVGRFSNELSKSHIAKCKPVSWWERYGDNVPLLQSLACRVLSQVL